MSALDVRKVKDGCIVLIYGIPKVIQASNTRFIDAGNFDGDGKLEFLFKYESDFYDGYVLFYDNFKENVDFNWEYYPIKSSAE